MSLPHIILSQLKHYGELTGYDVTVKFKSNDGLCWVASHQQVYRELAKLEDRGLCSHILIPQEGKPDKKIFKLNKSGELELGVWQKTKSRELGYRDNFAAKVQSIRGGGKDDVIKSLETEILHVEDEIAKLENVSPRDIVDDLMLDRRLSNYEWRKDWAVRALTALLED